MQTITERQKMMSLIENQKTGEIDGALSLSADVNNDYKTITDAAGNIIDYQNIKIAGYASTYGIDSDDEEMMPGAFTENLKTYKKNAVLCFNHYRLSENAGVGKATALLEDKKGLWLEGMLSNAPGLRDLRFKTVEGIVRGLSVAGRFTMEFGKNFVKIHKVKLAEVSLCIAPAQPEALFTVKAESSEHPKKMDSADAVEIEIDGQNFTITE